MEGAWGRGGILKKNQEVKWKRFGELFLGEVAAAWGGKFFRV